ncbi:hypothetical protein EG68_03218 [Paragonimus skrjabini miyazakii]|uniref:NIF3-like protein 1 n=1 Tax=Paragonimus skrjabini miyazakii TaxID=59628 RepID=A0A8S9Z8J5_9TREM|nr:hypothetical protein EG68_03218 [Paragonimus skrjabini miyazakii]
MRLASFTRNCMELSNLVRVLKQYCSPHLADTWDNVGLLVEPSPPHIVNSVLVTNDLTEPVLSEAISNSVNFVISYHPPIFTPLKRITQAQWKERIVARCFENHIAVFSPHTGLDAKKGGVNDWLLSRFDCDWTRAITPTPYKREPSVALRVAVSDSIGRLLTMDDLSLSSIGVSKSACRIVEFTCAVSRLKDVSTQLNELGVKIEDELFLPQDDLLEGFGRLTTLRSVISLSSVIEIYKKLFGVERLLVALGDGKTLDYPVRTIAVCAGSGGSILRETVARSADVFVTGEMSHHERLDAVSSGISVILAGHSVSERGYLAECLVPELQTLFDDMGRGDIPGTRVSVKMSQVDREPGLLF